MHISVIFAQVLAFKRFSKAVLKKIEEKVAKKKMEAVLMEMKKVAAKNSDSANRSALLNASSEGDLGRVRDLVENKRVDVNSEISYVSAS